MAWGHGKGHPKFEAFDMSLPFVYMCAVLTQSCEGINAKALEHWHGGMGGGILNLKLLI